jgi:hypothetical protein
MIKDFFLMNWMPPSVASNYKMSPISILCFDPLEELTTVQPPHIVAVVE